ncbi:hypothetical protein EMMF5_003593 [Cystobasidiomycetes sp. EMM_F5]
MDAEKSSLNGSSEAVVTTTQVEAVTNKDDSVAKFLAEVATTNPELLADWTPAEERKILRRKIDPIVITLSQFALMMGAVDKVCIGTAATLGMRVDLGLVGQQYSWISSMIYFGAIVAVLPSLFIMQKVPTAKWISFNCAVWGVLLMCSAACKSFATLAVVRFILGLFESIIFAGFSIIITAWWKKEEQPWRTAVIFSTLSSVVNGTISYGCSIYHGSLAQWQLLFILVGAITFLWSILCWFFLAGSPLEAVWLSTREKVIATRRLAVNMTGIENKLVKKDQIIEAFLDPKSWLVFCINNAPPRSLQPWFLSQLPSFYISSQGPTSEAAWQVQTILLANTGGYTKKTVTYAISYIGCPQVFTASQAPRYEGGVAAMLAILLVGIYWLYVVYLNKRKAIQLAEYEAANGDKADLLGEWHDLTDKQNPRFVYII